MKLAVLVLLVQATAVVQAFVQPLSKTAIASQQHPHHQQQQPFARPLFSVVPDKDSTEKDSQDNKQDVSAFSFESATHSIPLGLDQAPIPYADLTIGVLKEDFPGETRVSQTPDSVQGLVKAGFTVLVQAGGMYKMDGRTNELRTNQCLFLMILFLIFYISVSLLLFLFLYYYWIAGELAGFSDASYSASGAVVLQAQKQVLQDADILTHIQPPSEALIPQLAHKTLISTIQPAIHTNLYTQLTLQNTTVLALDCVPRMLSRGQAFDTLSSQANIAGYRAVIEAAQAFGRFFAGQMTAAGKVPPAKVLVLGAGVAGLAAIQTAKNMGAIVRAFDVRAVTQEQVESMGATFLKVDNIEEDGAGSGGYAKEMSDAYKQAQAALMMEQAKDVDIIITTALIPGKKAPVLVTDEMLNVMKEGSVCVDLAAANGGNVAQTQPDQIVTTDKGVQILGYTNWAARLPTTASNLFANNVAKFILSMGPQTTGRKGFFQWDLEDDAVQNMLIACHGKGRWPDDITPFAPPPPPVVEAVEEPEPLTEEELLALATEQQQQVFTKNAAMASTAAVLLVAFGLTADSPESVHLLATFCLAGLAGYQVVWGVAPALHSPLMAVTNAISGMTAVGGMLLLGHAASETTGLIPDSPAHWMGALATALSFVNIAGGFLVSGKMLDLFKRPTDPPDFFEYYAVPAGIVLSGLVAAGVTGGNLEAMAGSAGVASAICCIAGIAGLANQESARTGNVLGMAGVTFGLAATTAEMSAGGASMAAFEQGEPFAEQNQCWYFSASAIVTLSHVLLLFLSRSFGRSRYSRWR